MASPLVSASRLASLLGTPPARGRANWLAGGIIRLITDGRLPLGTRLPSERDLATRLGHSRGTVVRALDLVVEHGFLEARRGSGRTVRLPVGARRPIESLAARAVPVPAGAIDLRSTVLPPHPELAEAATAAVEGIPDDPTWGSTPADGLPVLVGAICRHYERRGLPTSPDQVIVTAGAVAGLHLALLSVTRAGARVGVENPCYPNTARVAVAAGRRPVPIDVAGGHDQALVDAVGSVALSAAMLTWDFHNPTGRLVGAEARRRVVRAAAGTGTALVIDETLADVNWRRRQLPAPIGADTESGAPVMLVGSVSKSLWAGLRIGWIRTSSAQADAISRIRLGVDLGGAVLEQQITARLLDDLREDGAPACTERLAEQYGTLTSALSALLPHWEASDPDGGLSLWCTGLRRPSTTIVAEAARRGLALSPGGLFSPTGRGWQHALRLPFTAPAEDLCRAADVLGQIDPA